VIANIHILINPDPDPAMIQMKATQEELLIKAHRRGYHPYGSMRRECPLCQLGKP